MIIDFQDSEAVCRIPIIFGCWVALSLATLVPESLYSEKIDLILAVLRRCAKHQKWERIKKRGLESRIPADCRGIP